MGTLNSWNPLGHSRPVTGLLYRFNVDILEYTEKQKVIDARSVDENLMESMITAGALLNLCYMNNKSVLTSRQAARIYRTAIRTL